MHICIIKVNRQTQISELKTLYNSQKHHATQCGAELVHTASHDLNFQRANDLVASFELLCRVNAVHHFPHAHCKTRRVIKLCTHPYMDWKPATLIRVPIISRSC